VGLGGFNLQQETANKKELGPEWVQMQQKKTNSLITMQV
jgi:hypothetical protein